MKYPRRIITNKGATGQQTNPGPKSQDLVATEHVQTSDFQHSVWAHSGTPLRIAGGGNIAGGEFNTTTVTKGPALRLLQIEQYVLRRFLSVRVLDGHVHLVEEAQIVQAPLRGHHSILAQGIVVVNAHLVVHDVRTGKLQPAHDHAIHEDLLAFSNGVNHIHAMRLVRSRIGRSFELYIREAVVVVEKSDTVPVSSDVRLAVRLAWEAAQQLLQPVKRVAVVACNLQRVHQRLRTFLDFDYYRDLVLPALIIFLKVGVYLDLQEAVGLVKVLDGVEVLGQ